MEKEDSNTVKSAFEPSFIAISEFYRTAIIDYIRGKFATLKNSNSIIKAETVADNQLGGYMTKICQTNPATNQSAIVYYRIQVDNNKIVKGDLCMF